MTTRTTIETQSPQGRTPARRARRQALHWLIVVALLAGAVLINQSAVHWRSNIVDDHLFAYYGWCVSEGARPYLDIWDNKPPGIWWINAAAFGICGPGVAGELLLGSLALLTSLLAFVGIARTAFHKSLLLPATLTGIVLLTHLQFECGGNRTETYMVTCETLAVLGYLRWLHRGRLRWLLLAGLFAGAAPLFKQSGLAVAVAGGLHLAWVQWRTRRTLRSPTRGWRPWLVAGGSLACAPLLAAIVLASHGALAEAAFAVGRFNRAYFAINDATWFEIDRALIIFDPVLKVLAPVLVIAGIGVVSGCAVELWRRATGRTDRLPRRGVGVFVLWFVLAAYLACVGPGRRGHHLMPALPALGLLVLYPLHLLVGRHGLRASLTARPAAAALVVAWAYVLGLLLVGSLHEATRSWQVKPAWYALRRSQPAPYEAQAARIVELTQPGDTIYVWGWSPGTYRWAYRLPASRYATIEKLGQVGEYARFIIDGAMADIRRHPPAVFVISTNDYPGMVSQHPDDFADWLHRQYDISDTIEGMHILTKRRAEATPESRANSIAEPARQQ